MWTVGSGTTTSLWEDWWCGKDSFKVRWGNNGILHDNIMVEDIINDEGKWDIVKAAAMIPALGMNDVLSTPLPLSNVVRKDTPSWGLTGNGKFSLGSCYLLTHP